MSLPYTIANGDTPDATKLQDNFDYLADGKGVKRDTLANLKTFAATDPTAAFDCWATDEKLRMFYTGDITDGDGGFITIGGS